MKESIHLEIREELESTLNEWIELGVKGVKYLEEDNWKVDEILFFNTEKSEALLMVLGQDTSKNAKMDFIQMVYAKKVSLHWEFYYYTMPTIVASRYDNNKPNPQEPYQFGQLSNIAKRKVINGGYFKRNCKINDQYISDWYTPTLEKSQQKFLDNIIAEELH